MVNTKIGTNLLLESYMYNTCLQETDLLFPSVLSCLCMECEVDEVSSLHVAKAVSAHCHYYCGYWYKLRGNMICIDVNNLMSIACIVEIEALYSSIFGGFHVVHQYITVVEACTPSYPVQETHGHAQQLL